MIREEALVRTNKSMQLTNFAGLYDQYAPGLWGLILKFTNDNHLAEEILEESFIDIWKRFEEYDPSKTNLLSWMVSITINQCVCRLHLSKFELLKRLNLLLPLKQIRSNEQ